MPGAGVPKVIIVPIVASEKCNSMEHPELLLSKYHILLKIWKSCAIPAENEMGSLR